MYDNSFEKFPGETPNTSTEAELRAEEWQTAMSEGVPEFAGDTGVPKPEEPATAETPTTTEVSKDSTTPDDLASKDTPDTPDRPTLNPEILA